MNPELRAKAIAAAQAVAARLRAASETGGFGAECAGIGFGGCGAGAVSAPSFGAPSFGAFSSVPPPPPSVQAESFFASLAPPPPCVQQPMPAQPLNEDRGAQRRRTGFDVTPPTGGTPGSAQHAALAAALKLADSLSSGRPGSSAPHPAPTKSLDDILARDRVRIASAHERNQQYVQDKDSNTKYAKKAAAAAAAAAFVNAAQSSENIPGVGVPATRPKPSSRGSVNAGACSVYVSGLPRDVTVTEVTEHFEIVSASPPHSTRDAPLPTHPPLLAPPPPPPPPPP